MIDFDHILLNSNYLSIELKRWEKTCYVIVAFLNGDKHVLSKDNKALTFRHQWQAVDYLEEKYNVPKEDIHFVK